MNNIIKAILLSLIASFCAVLMDVFLKYAQSDTNVYTVGFIRFLIGFLIIFPYISFKKFAVYKSKNLKLHITRAVLNVPMMILGFSSLVYIPLEQIKAISFLSPIIVVVLSVFILKEKIYFIRIFALLIGFIGVILIIRPGIIHINTGVYMVLGSCLIWSIIIIVTKFLSKDDSPITILTYQYSFVTIFAFPLAVIFWHTPSIISLVYIFFAALSGTILHLCLNQSYKLADLSIIQPIWFTGLIFGSFFGYFLFDERPDIFTWIGGSIIFSSVLIITYRENYLKKDLPNKSIPIN